MRAGASECVSEFVSEFVSERARSTRGRADTHVDIGAVVQQQVRHGCIARPALRIRATRGELGGQPRRLRIKARLLCSCDRGCWKPTRTRDSSVLMFDSTYRVVNRGRARDDI